MALVSHSKHHTEEILVRNYNTRNDDPHDGNPRWIWDDGAHEWTRAGPMNVALKRLDNSQNVSNSYINQIKAYHKCLQSASLAGTFGITKDPTSNYIDMIDMLWGIAGGLERIHAEGKIHGNLHGGNYLLRTKKFLQMLVKTDICGLTIYCSGSLRGENYNTNSDIYSFGGIMNKYSCNWERALKKRPLISKYLEEKSRGWNVRQEYPAPGRWN
ncbi:hypothetical protein C1645_743650 [Glomus cerebriforme]|uniref:Protein kinase domain-containing protein n=1 Tax=Glomus cerebriforme TaxID=658196 RepID=A0A397SD39_9GLOM|nr:hypothetical protein C1645_743650 [Glomus cerebriforme]